MKRILYVLLAAVVVLSLAVFASAEEVRPVYVTLNGEAVDCASYGQEATIVEGRTMVPLRAIFEALGATVEWNQGTKTVTSVLDETEIKLTIGENVLYRNGESVELDVPALIMNNRTLVPVRAISEAFGVYVEWDAGTRTVLLTAVNKEYVRGVVEGNTYIGEWTGLVYEAPEGVIFVTDEQIYEMMESAGGLVADPETGKMIMDFAKANVVYEFVALDALGNNIQLAVEKNPEGLTAEEYVSHIKDGYALVGYDCSESFNYTSKIGGYTFVCIDVETKVQGIKMTQSFAVRNQDDRIIIMTLTTVSDGAYLMDGFMNISEHETEDTEAGRAPDGGFADISEAEVPAEAIEVVNAFLEEFKDYNIKEALKYCVDADEYKDIDVSNVNEMLEYAGIDRDVLVQLMTAELPEDDEAYKALFGGVADIIFEFIPKANEKAAFTIDNVRIADENRIEFIVTTYAPKMNIDSEAISLNLQYVMNEAILEGKITENMSEGEIFAAIFDDFIAVLRTTLEEAMETEELETNGSKKITAVKTADGRWLVELPEEDAEVLHAIKNKDFSSFLPEAEQSLDGQHVYGDFYFGMTHDECLDVIEGEVETYEGDILIFDLEGIYDDEDKNITGDVNCDGIRLWFFEGKLYSVSVETPYRATDDEAKSVLKSVMEYYGSDYEYDAETDSYIWTNGNLEISCAVCLNEEGYFCLLDITDWS